MKPSSSLTILAIITISVTALFYFKPIWKDHLIPFPGNLLVSYFSPWKEEAWPGYPTGVPRKGLLGFDTVRMMGPWRNFITNEIKSGRFPSWNPHQFGGAPMSANFQSALFFPPNLIYLILPFHIAWTILVISQPILATVGMYLLLNASFKNFSLTPACISFAESDAGRHQRINALTIIFLSVTYGFSSWMSVWIEWNIHGFVYALLPFTLFFIYKRKTILTILTISAIIFSGHPQIAFIALTACAIFAVLNHSLKPFILSSVIALIITSIQWIPTARYYQQASREQQSSEFVYSKTLLPWSQLPQLIAPNFFGNPATGNFRGAANFVETTAYSGIAVLGFAVIGLIGQISRIRQINQIRKFSVFLIVLILILVLPNPLSLLIGKFNLPILSTSVVSRWLMLLPLATTLLASVGINRSLRNFLPSQSVSQTSVKIYFPAIFVFLIIVSLWIYTLFLLPEFRSVSTRNMIIPTAIAGLFLLTLLFRLAGSPASANSYAVAGGSDWRAGRHRTMRILLFIMAIFSIGELILFGWKTMPYTEKRFIYPVTPVLAKLQELSRDGSRFAATEGSVIESNFATYYGLYDLSGYDALYPRIIGELVWTANNNGIPVKDFSRSTAVVSAKQSDARNNLWNLAGVRWIINKDDLLAEHPGQKSNDLSSDFKLIWEEGKWQIYENTKVYPRAFFIPDISPAKQDPALQDLISPITPAEVTSYKSNEVEISVHSPADGYLVLTDTFYPGWKASVDGITVNILPAFGAFRAVQVSKGIHAIKFNL